jgi:hypothetical protein
MYSDDNVYCRKEKKTHTQTHRTNTIYIPLPPPPLVYISIPSHSISLKTAKNGRGAIGMEEDRKGIEEE